MSTSVSSGLVVQWFLFRGPVAMTSILPISPEVTQWSRLPAGLHSSLGCWTISWTQRSVEQELTVVSFQKPCSLFLTLLLGDLSGSEIYSGALFNVTLCCEDAFSLKMVFVNFVLSLLWLGSPSSYTTHSWCDWAHETMQERRGPVVVLCFTASLLAIVSFMPWAIKLSLPLAVQAACSSHSWPFPISSSLSGSVSAETTPNSVPFHQETP